MSQVACSGGQVRRRGREQHLLLPIKEVARPGVTLLSATSSTSPRGAGRLRRACDDLPFRARNLFCKAALLRGPFDAEYTPRAATRAPRSWFLGTTNAIARSTATRLYLAGPNTFNKRIIIIDKCRISHIYAGRQSRFEAPLGRKRVNLEQSHSVRPGVDAVVAPFESGEVHSDFGEWRGPRNCLGFRRSMEIGEVAKRAASRQ